MSGPRAFTRRDHAIAPRPAHDHTDECPRDRSKQGEGLERVLRRLLRHMSL